MTETARMMTPGDVLIFEAQRARLSQLEAQRIAVADKLEDLANGLPLAWDRDRSEIIGMLRALVSDLRTVKP
jgi:hypothetical protein